MCNTELDSQEHLLTCKELKKHIDINHNIKSDHIYGSLQEQIDRTLKYYYRLPGL